MAFHFSTSSAECGEEETGGAPRPPFTTDLDLRDPTHTVSLPYNIEEVDWVCNLFRSLEGEKALTMADLPKAIHGGLLSDKHISLHALLRVRLFY